MNACVVIVLQIYTVPNNKLQN